MMVSQVTVPSCLCGALLFASPTHAVEFNTDVLSAEDRDNIDFSRFSQKGYIIPGSYQMRVKVNGQSISASEMVIVFSDAKEKSLPQPCLGEEIIKLVGFTSDALNKINYGENGKCADLTMLQGVESRPSPGEGVLDIIAPVALLEYSDASWLPPSRWEDGIPGILLDYNLNGYVNHPNEGEKTQSLSYNGTTGANLGAWRLRADYQGNMTRTDGSGTESELEWNRIYMFRAIPQLESKLTLGENYVTSGIFDSWRYFGASIESDDRMLPPQFRDYAPQVSGVAQTNARVVVSHKGRVLYDTTVPAGPFSIQDLDSSVRGRLDVEVTEQDGQVKKFQVEAGYIPYLTRPGSWRYKLLSGRPMVFDGHATEGPGFISGEASWGASNRWSPYGGATLSEDYSALALGAAVDLSEFGAISTDLTHSFAKFSPGEIPGSDEDSLEGKSLRIAYFKRFEEANADVSFAGYRFSDANYMSMQQYLDARYRDDFSGREKELVTITLNKRFEDSQLGVSLQYNYQTYWDEESTSYYSISVDRYFDAFGFKNISFGVTASSSDYEGKTDDTVYARLSIPWGSGTISYNGSSSNGRYTQTAGYSGTLNDGMDSYNISAGIEHGDGKGSQMQANAYYSHRSDVATLSANISTIENSYTSYGVTATGGVTLTANGAALHAGGMNGGTRMLIDTDNVAGVPINGGRTTTNHWGIGVVTDMSSYYRNATSVDLNKLPENIDVSQPVVESALTEGAIGYRKIEVLKGEKLFAVLRMEDNSHPPFGASLTNAKGRELGMIGDDGLAWVSGVTLGESLYVKWNEGIQCTVSIPEKIKPDQQLLLPCHKTMKVQ